MSVESGSTRKPSPYREDEGGKESSRQQSRAAHRSGGVSADGMLGSDGRVNQEVCTGAARDREQPKAQAGQTGEAPGAGAEVGVSHSSVEARDSTTRAEPRGGTCVHTSQNSEGSGDGWESLLNEWTRIITPPKVRKLQRALYRKAKAEPKFQRSPATDMGIISAGEGWRGATKGDPMKHTRRAGCGKTACPVRCRGGASELWELTIAVGSIPASLSPAYSTVGHYLYSGLRVAPRSYAH
jgi:hypothetical protein